MQHRALGSDQVHPALPSFDTYLSLGGDFRERYEVLDPPDFSDANRDTDGYLLQRYMVHADLHIGEQLRAFAQLKSGLESGRRAGPRPPDEDRLDLHQAFAEGMLGDGARSLSLRIGRQEVAFGSSRLVSVRDPNVRRSFDGVRATVAALGWQLDGLALASAETERGKFDDETDRGERLWGAYAAGPVLGEALGLDLYILGLRRDDSEYDQGTHGSPSDARSPPARERSGRARVGLLLAPEHRRRHLSHVGYAARLRCRERRALCRQPWLRHLRLAAGPPRQGRYALRVGEIDVLVVSDGVLTALPAATLAVNATPAALAAWLDDMVLPPAFDWPVNVVVVRSGGRTVLIDAGIGVEYKDFRQAGRLLLRLEAAGIDPASLTDVVLTHLHMDHIGGLLTDGVKGRLRPDLRIHVAAAEAEFWAGPAALNASMLLWSVCI